MTDEEKKLMEKIKDCHTHSLKLHARVLALNREYVERIGPTPEDQVEALANEFMDKVERAVKESLPQWPMSELIEMAACTLKEAMLRDIKNSMETWGSGESDMVEAARLAESRSKRALEIRLAEESAPTITE